MASLYLYFSREIKISQEASPQASHMSYLAVLDHIPIAQLVARIEIELPYLI